MTRFTSQGKQVLYDGAHYADACDTEAAEAIVGAMNGQGWRTIETAPRDGVPFLVVDQFGDYDIARWHHDHVCGETFGSHAFTDWMPLPKAPDSTPSLRSEGI